jgi:cell division protease FtsH
VRFCTALLRTDYNLLEAMTLTENEPIVPSADTVGDADPCRQPIDDVGAYLDSLPDAARVGLRALGELLVGVTQRPPRAETADLFTARTLGVINAGQLIDEERELDPVSRLTTAVALTEWITCHANVIEVGPGEYALPPAWTQTEIGGRTYRHPQCLRVHFPAGTVLADTGCVIAIDARRAGMGSPQLSAYVTPDHQDGARLALNRLTDRANDLNPYRGRALRATNAGGLHLSVIDLPSKLTRDTVILDDEVWREIDLGLTAVRDRHDLLNTHGLGSRRGVLLCGPPGTGKSAVSARSPSSTSKPKPASTC